MNFIKCMETRDSEFWQTWQEARRHGSGNSEFNQLVYMYTDSMYTLDKE